ncbi:MAG: imidazole glycerol phosphate synthase cyclase subunit [Gammaproteobacteria bacterium RIFCSPLOWO2_02_FULL_42_14]|nr:MAG: imidazole glycerol phosphate synthase cyclase subunit [Gammaproteobacteria bacterium RIFCSPHIGHO2_02_FULL_42_43]OGT28560.1 MAG: imidazole glycerol phosphate synthase cyclase subunit [Gammaproteobacteria bacterium RIFCSPHIGHO2_01_FULL_42_8]OGT51382.1 MAG: imidazole glycerol phosphate synthase cyclase subunit [Gammaproteobacteria bacterium RIFCSPHIGHO2_12_FULL_41_25]OGT62084.1 MAG: imidazole glycerol phosphate synthase cyclase subunit [Gammaproteobacteria bacterium RIFCSPLOWO2_02_FULL_42_1
MRIIARVDVKNGFVIKGIHLEGLRKLGDPKLFLKKYYERGADEIILMDAVASLYDRNNLFDLLKSACEEIFIPVTIGGGLRTLADVKKALLSGADKIAINTAAIKSPKFISEIANSYGSQCVVASIEAKKINSNRWEAYIDNGREKTGLDVLEWATKLQTLGAGEIMLTSIDQEGTKNGFDIELIKAINDGVTIPVIACGGMGALSHIDSLCCETTPSAIACASVLHYDILTMQSIRERITYVNQK